MTMTNSDGLRFAEVRTVSYSDQLYRWYCADCKARGRAGQSRWASSLRADRVKAALRHERRMHRATGGQAGE